MGVYIKGMEMSKEGRYTVCITQDSGDGVHWVFQNQDTLEFLKHSGVTEVPEHGRLIEKNSVFEFIQSMSYVDKLLPVEFVKALYEIPTVIPADQQKEES